MQSTITSMIIGAVLLSSGIARGVDMQSVIKLIRDSETALAASQFGEALSLAREATRQDPAYAPSWHQLGVVELRSRQYDQAVRSFRESLAIEPSQTNIWKALALAEWNAGKSEDAIAALRKHLSIQPQDAGANHDLAGWLAAIGATREAAEIIRGLASSKMDDATLWKELGVIYFRDGNYESARDAYEESLKIMPDDPAVHRDLAWCYWSMHEKSAARPLLEKALASTLTYLKADPGNVPLNVMAGRMMSALEMKDDARDHFIALLARNTNFVPALAYLREDATTRRAFDEAAGYAAQRARAEPSNIGAKLDLANSLAQNDQFIDALAILRKLAKEPVANSIPVLAYQALNEFDNPGRNTIDQIISHIEIAASLGYRLDSQFSRAAGNTKVAVMIIQGANERDLAAIDERLAAHKGKAIYAGGLAASPGRKAGRPGPGFLHKLQETGRWLIIPQIDGIERKPINADGVLGNPLTHALFIEQAMEGPREKELRIREIITRMKSNEFINPDKMFVYPHGDYGQKSLDVSGADLSFLAGIADQVFNQGIYFSDQGFFMAGTHEMKIPALEVSPIMTTGLLKAHLTKDNPLVAARLELAKVLYWHRQYEAANYWFAEAEKAGADPFNLYFSWGACADNQGDIPTAMEKLSRAKELNPDDERLADLLKRAEHRQNTKSALAVRNWDDNEGRSFFQWGAGASAHMGDSLRLGFFADRNHWELNGEGSENGSRLGAAAYLFIAPQIWVEGGLWQLGMEDADDLTGGDALIHLPFRWSSGFFELSASRDEIETVEALREGLYADTYRIHNYSRLADRFDLFATLKEMDRSDENSTQMLEARLLYRVKEWPHVGAGYHGRIADSDEDPPAYWAPEELEQHQAHLNARRTYGATRLTLSGDAGYAREKDRDWKFVWGANGTMETFVYGNLSLRAQLQYYESPTYHRTSGMLGVGYEF